MKEKKLEDCFSLIKNGANIKQYKGAVGIPITRIETLADNIFNRERLGYANVYDITKYKDYLLKDGDILMSHINSVKYLGRSVLYKRKKDEIIIHGMNLLRLVAIRSIIQPEFVVYYFLSHHFNDQVLNITKKAVNQASFTVSDLKKIKIIAPPLSLQTLIVAELDKLNEILAKKREQLKELDRLGQAIFYDMFGDPSVNNKKMKMSTIGDIAISVTYGTSKPASEFGKYPYLRMNNITYTGSLDLSNLKYIDLSDLEVEKFLVKKGDILFNRTNSKDLVGKTTYFPYNMPMVIAGYLIRVRLKEYMDSIFVSYYMNTYYIKTYLKGLCKSIIGMANINAKELQRIPIFLPPLTQQSLFAQKINALESQKQKIKESIVEVQQLLDYTMNKYFG